MPKRPALSAAVAQLALSWDEARKRLHQDQPPPPNLTRPEEELLAHLHTVAMMASSMRTLQYQGETLPLIYSGVEEFVLAHGVICRPRPLPEDIPLRTPRLCFKNALDLSCERRGLHYVEGFAMGLIPVHHAWCVDDAGNVVDPTWEETGTAYMGVPLQPGYVLRAVRERGYYGVLDNPERGWPLLTKQTGHNAIDFQWVLPFMRGEVVL